MKYVPTDPDEAAWHEAERARAFQLKYGRPAGSDAAAYEEWLAKVVPKDRRQVAVYLHSTVGDLCGICRTAVDISLLRPHPAAAEVDHLVPRVRGGPDTWRNVRITHAYCNALRSDASYGEPDPDYAAAGLLQAIKWFNDPEARESPRLVRAMARMEKLDRLAFEWREARGVPHPERALGPPADDGPEWYRALTAWRSVYTKPGEGRSSNSDG